MARLARRRSTHLHRIAVVDDDTELLSSTIRLFASEGHEVRGASNPADAIELVRSFRPQLLLLDYYMQGGTGADVVSAIREFDPLVQVLLVTGYASEQPARTLLAELDIQGFHDKSDGPQRLMILSDAALKHYRSLERAERQSAYLRFILDVAPDVSRLQPARDLLQTALGHAVGLLKAGSGLIATEESGLFILSETACESVSIQAAIGRYAGQSKLAGLSPQMVAVVRAGLAANAPFAHESGSVVIPLVTRGGDRGCMVIEGATLPPDGAFACQIYAQQVVQALENLVLFERATVDPLTTLYRRDFGVQRLTETLRLGTRMKVPTTAILLDVDHFKRLNDTYGHAAGDLTLRALSTTLSDRCRTTDVVARYGGEEILVVLPATDFEGGMILADRLRAAVAELVLEFEGSQITTSVSIGVATAEPGCIDVDDLLRRADKALYRAKDGGRNRVCGEKADAAA